MTLLFAVCAAAETTNTLSDAEIQGRQLAQQLCDAPPAESLTNTGVLKIRDKEGKRREIPVKCEVIVTAINWRSVYETTGMTSNQAVLAVIHTPNTPNKYYKYDFLPGDKADLWPSIKARPLSANELMAPFAASDFWLCDLGLEFFHWPGQKVLKKEFRRNCSCMVLESTNPIAAANGYARVDSWIDEESGGIVMANAYDANGKLLKEFYPKDVKKVKGQWQVQSMEIDNVQTGSRTRLEFDLKAP
ncbi:MAG TPA: outer membrane lipoprotein-sorting protein [Verrucomicrobiae bacterium]|nr:outer membrane lipoprotein-sorting protein [Verrucomicrobiae bacterium]